MKRRLGFRAGGFPLMCCSSKPTRLRGWDVFRNKGRCVTCHEFNASSPFFTDFKYHNSRA